MIRRYPLLLIICGFILIIGLVLWPGHWSPSASANVTLVDFTATSLPGQPGISVRWETATEINTVGFFVLRGDSFSGVFTRESGFIPHEGDTIVGAKYEWLDAGAVLTHTYLYQLEEIATNQQSEFYGPITVTVGISGTVVSPPSNTPSATPTRTPTVTPSPTTTPTVPAAAEDVDPTPPSNSRPVVTPRVALGQTITPRPTSSPSSSSSSVAFAVAPTLSAVPSSSLPPTSAAAVAPVVPGAATAATVVAPPSPTAAHVAQAPAATLASTDEASAVVEPVVIAAEAAPRTTSTNSTNSGALILFAAAILFLGIALLMLRQARQ